MRTDKYEMICALCENSQCLFDSDTALCRYKGVVPKDYSCRKFSYDPLKRIPPKPQTAPELDYIDIEER